MHLTEQVTNRGVRREWPTPINFTLACLQPSSTDIPAAGPTNNVASNRSGLALRVVASRSPWGRALSKCPELVEGLIQVNLEDNRVLLTMVTHSSVSTATCGNDLFEAFPPFEHPTPRCYTRYLRRTHGRHQGPGPRGPALVGASGDQARSPRPGPGRRSHTNPQPRPGSHSAQP